jgi:Cys-rich protein (TIGR01571 family)
MAGLFNQVAGNALSAVGIKRQWSSGLCDCCRDTGSCCDVYFCTCCQVARQCNAIDGRSNQNDICLCCVSLIMMYYGYGTNVLAMILRYRLVAKYSITGESVIMTFINSTCCPLCSMCQTHRELTSMALWPGGTCCGAIAPNPIAAMS